jgi:predicted transcriptional regulator
MPQDQVLEALDEVEEELRLTKRRADAGLRWTQRLRRERARDREYATIMRTGARPHLVELLSQILAGVRTAGSRLRRATAGALRREGMTTDEIATLFGVSRQRVSRLVQDHDETAS